MGSHGSKRRVELTQENSTFQLLILPSKQATFAAAVPEEVE